MQDVINGVASVLFIVGFVFDRAERFAGPLPEISSGCPGIAEAVHMAPLGHVFVARETRAVGTRCNWAFNYDARCKGVIVFGWTTSFGAILVGRR